jgi:hypothetical protein
LFELSGFGLGAGQLFAVVVGVTFLDLCECGESLGGLGERGGKARGVFL